MTNEPSIPNADEPAGDVLELVTDDDETWTAIPGRVTGDETQGQWITVAPNLLCDLEEWR
ncbi:hypothetical protein [Halostagnicola kamekurae]|uniref:Uncharacterized protein n=1 Tax=Halostagnicola kamekurae TaxID=619731 RepID=A0A1I6SDG7_9EURY|nr:hypothetical protein [Halostagnicola kamekurae]SFS74974.1 hypothetical protein SAMN04488556_2586 [Halostagnicola kamekurae]